MKKKSRPITADNVQISLVALFILLVSGTAFIASCKEYYYMQIYSYFKILNGTAEISLMVGIAITLAISIWMIVIIYQNLIYDKEYWEYKRKNENDNNN